MTAISLTVPKVGEKNSEADPQTQAAFEELVAFLNGANLDATNLKAEGITEALLAPAVKTLLGKLVSGLTIAFRSVSLTAANGELVQAGATMTVTTPTPVQSASFGVLANGHEVTIKTTTEIKGDFVPSGAKEVKLVGQQHLILVCDGAAWYITAGEPKREQVYSAETKRASAATIEASASRPAFVTVWSNPTTLSRVEVGPAGSLVTIGHPSTAVQAMASFYLPPGQSWKVTTANGEEYLSNTLLL